MNLTQWENELRNSYMQPNVTSGSYRLWITGNHEHTAYRLYHAQSCYHCGAKTRTTVTVGFYEPQDSLSQFQAALLFGLAHGVQIGDYAQYHKISAGQQFIENIWFIKKKEEVISDSKLCGIADYDYNSSEGGDI